MELYLDNAATTKLSDDLKKYITDSLLNIWGNPSTLYKYGSISKVVLENARKSVAKFINANTDNIIFTPNATTSNNLAMIQGDYVLYSPIAHKSIIKRAKSMSNTMPLRVYDNGLIDVNNLSNMLCDLCVKEHKNVLVVVDYANSEIGTVQEVKPIINISHLYGAKVYLDCTGSISTIPIDVKSLDVDMIGFSGHKLGSLKGVGVFYSKDIKELKPLIYGSQELGLVAGTENVLAIGSLEYVLDNYDYSLFNCDVRDYFLKELTKSEIDFILVGSKKDRLCNNLYICIKDIDSFKLSSLLEIHGYYLSTGSACNQGSLKHSDILDVLKVKDEYINGGLRISFSCLDITKEDIDNFIFCLKECVNYLIKG